MPQSLSSILIHLIFSTKPRQPLLTPQIEVELHPYMVSIFRAIKSPALSLDGTEDHVHILFALSRVITIADLVEEVKTAVQSGSRRRARSSKTFTGKVAMELFP